MDNVRKTYCSCGEWHDFDEGTVKKLRWDEIPEYIECPDCPECNPDVLDKIEDHEDEAYNENVNIEDLNGNMNIEDFEDDFAEEY